MRPFKKILVPTDFSEHANFATHTAIDLAQHYGASVSLIHVLRPLYDALPAGFVPYTPPAIAEILAALNDELAALAKPLSELGAGQVGHQVLSGDPRYEIVEHARQGGYDLIVMGTHGRSGIAHVILGSVAERVVRGAHCPVLIVRSAEKP
jgi:nucleotide-binding universal stress UspA family protein